MKNLVFLFVITLISSCANYTKQKTEPFSIKGATFNYWSGGQGVTGTRIIIPYSTKEKVDFKRVYFQGKSTEVEYKKQRGRTYIFGFITNPRQQNDLVVDVDPSKEIKNNKPDISLPFKLKADEIAISYVENGETKYYLIKNTVKTETDYYP